MAAVNRSERVRRSKRERKLLCKWILKKKTTHTHTHDVVVGDDDKLINAGSDTSMSSDTHSIDRSSKNHHIQQYAPKVSCRKMVWWRRRPRRAGGSPTESQSITFHRNQPSSTHSSLGDAPPRRGARSGSGRGGWPSGMERLPRSARPMGRCRTLHAPLRPAWRAAVPARATRAPGAGLRHQPRVAAEECLPEPRQLGGGPVVDALHAPIRALECRAPEQQPLEHRAARSRCAPANRHLGRLCLAARGLDALRLRARAGPKGRGLCHGGGARPPAPQRLWKRHAGGPLVR
jgi:hypothetical protein